jgi:hypothetical protein
MASTVSLIGLLLCISLLEGMWTWLLVAAISEVAGQTHPPLLGFVSIPLLAWFSSRLTLQLDIPLERRRMLLMGGGLVLAFVIGTIHSGLLHPLQLVFPPEGPDFRAAGILYLLAVTYLWGRGLALAVSIGRERVLNHVMVSTAGLAVVLLALPLTDAIRGLGLVEVVCQFLISVAALLLVQLTGVESRNWSRLHWAGVASGASSMVLVAAAFLTGAVSSESIGLLGQVLQGVGQTIKPVTDAIFLAGGFLAQILTNGLLWLRDTFGVDPQQILQNIDRADGDRPHFDPIDPNDGPPMIMTLSVVVFLTLLFVWTVGWIYYRLVYRRSRGDDEEVDEEHVHTGGGGLGGLLRGLRNRFGPGEDDGLGADARAVTRRHYRSFQLLMVRAGIGRRDGQTPEEYERQVAAALPGAGIALRELTAAYVVARYAEPDASLPEVETLGTSVERIRDALRTQDLATTP